MGFVGVADISSIGGGGDRFSCPQAKSRFLADGAMMALTSVCAYRKCTIRHLHATRVCPALHHLCTSCGMCGHAGGCQTTWSWIRDALVVFEEVASQGVHTRKHFEEPEWGFFPRRRSDSSGHVLPSYQQLLDMEPIEAYQFSVQECPSRITRTHLWSGQHHLHAYFECNRPERYDLRVRTQ